ncbi:hypothetical protein I4U23_018024 [Adineta vaga]|nr:hypothetical protein I4U23_018024 [Adineta vaga]
MNSSHSSLPYVDRANSTLFKRYLDEQQKSVTKSGHYQTLSRPINSTIQITHTHRQQQETYTTKLTDTNTNLQQIIIKRKYSNGRKPSIDASKQRTSHTNRFMKRFQRQHKTGETITNVQKRDGRLLFEFPESSTTNQTRTDHGTHCTCLASSDGKPGHHHHHHNCPLKPTTLPRLSLNELFHSSSDHPGIQSLTTNDSLQQESISNKIYPIESSSLMEPTTTIDNNESEMILFDNPTINISNEHWPLINDFLQEISIEMTDKPSVDILLEIEESLAQRIYDCIVEREDDETENDIQSYSTLTNDSSAVSAPAPTNNLNSHESTDLPPSPINTNTHKAIDNRDKYFQPIREQPSSSFHNHLDRNQHSTPFNPITKQISDGYLSNFDHFIRRFLFLRYSITIRSIFI